MPPTVERIQDLNQEASARLVMDMLHRIIVHYALWFTEVRHQMGHAKALEALLNVSEKSWGLQLKRLSRHLEERQLALEVSPPLRAQLAEIGYDPQYGARPLKRTLQRIVLDPLARHVLEGTFAAGDTVRADWDNEKGTVSCTRVAAAADAAAAPA